MNDKYWSPSDMCKGCGRQSVSGSYLCDICRRLMRRIDTRKDADGRSRISDKEARLSALRSQWDGESECFRCYFTGIPLTGTHGSTDHPTWEHRVPGDEKSVVLVADLVNRMKADMTEDEFRRLVKALARHFDGEGFEEEAFPRRTRRI